MHYRGGFITIVDEVFHACLNIPYQRKRHRGVLSAVTELLTCRATVLSHTLRTERSSTLTSAPLPANRNTCQRKKNSGRHRFAFIYHRFRIPSSYSRSAISSAK